MDCLDKSQTNLQDQTIKKQTLLNQNVLRSVLDYVSCSPWLWLQVLV